jgi:hypothetical protein
MSCVAFYLLRNRLPSSACSAVVVTPCQRLLRVQGMMPYFLAVAEILIDSWIPRSAIALSIALIAAEISRVEVLLLLLIELCMTWVLCTMWESL